MMIPQMYDAQADSIKIEDIATNDNNILMLERIRRNSSDDSKVLYIQNQHDDDGEECMDYVPEGAKDMGWLGYFVGKNNHLTEMSIMNNFTSPNASVTEILEPFFRGVNNNKSIHTLNFYGRDLLGGQIFTMMDPFFKNNDNLEVISIEDCIFGDEGSRLLALALGNCKTSLQSVTLMSNDDDTTKEGLVDIITSLSMHPNIQYFDLDGNQMSTNGCIAMATLLQHSCTQLQHLDLSRIELDDEGIDILVPALKNCNSLDKLYMHDNDPVTSRGWQHLASILEAPNSNLTEVGLGHNVDNKALAAFADALINNNTLETLKVDYFASVDADGWQSFSGLLCNTSTVNSTFLSNHTLHNVDGYGGTNARFWSALRPLFTLNQREDKKKVAMIKTLQHHNDFDMTPFFEWEFKVLPLMINWLERASFVTMPGIFGLEPRKLSSIYQFVKGMPLLYVETRLKRELEEIRVAETQMEEEQQELTGKLLDLETKHQLSQKRKRSIMERLDQRL